MDKKTVTVFPDKITIDGIVSEGKMRLLAHLHTDLNLKSDNVLAISIQLEQLKNLHATIGEYLDLNKEK
ncbi:TPA: hypothetical protein ACW1B7_001062 [Escherichia coli]|nr:hypothetical protein [Escherichia coli]ALL92666.1 hypothetical protein AKK22_07365 [Escherichia coli]EEC9534621.1 hypothetical protein [Escherichia coli]EED0759470.1 hypothetical protein [Escherichia coli]EED1636445.1 hypothetical protein [Escherichia coli]EEQ5351171.1 hypothetical protein [Escherichia coli]